MHIILLYYMGYRIYANRSLQPVVVYACADVFIAFAIKLKNDGKPAFEPLIFDFDRNELCFSF